MRGAVAIFVKTAGVSPLKTRLAAGIGEAAALAFYRLACDAVRSVVERTGLAAYWAVAETEALDRWRGKHPGLDVVPQGTGGLGERLDRVYSELLARHGEVHLIGADAPQIVASDFTEARRRLDGGAAFALGPARDGGFWLMSGRRPVPRADWLAVPYSAETTRACLEERLAPIGRVETLALRGDVDVVEDLRELVADLRALPETTPEQGALSAWVRELVAQSAQPV